MKPLSESSLLRPVKNASSPPARLPVRGSMMPVPDEAVTGLMRSSIPFERPLLPFIDKADGQHRKEHHHRPESEGAELAERDRPGEQERHFQIKNDEQNCDEVEAHVEFHARVV